MLNVTINGENTSIELDTGCEASTLSADVWKNRGSPQLQQTHHVFRTYTGQTFLPIGALKASILRNG